MVNTATRASHVRQFEEADITQVADVHRLAFQLPDDSSPELSDAYRIWLTEVFLRNPWRDETVGSLVCEDQAGRIKGFLGVMPQRMNWNGQPVRVAIMSNFVVDSESRGITGMKLLRTFLDGPQDLSITDEASADVRRIWEGLGGTTSLPYSMHWYYPLGPCQFAAFAAKRQKLVPAFVSRLCSPVALAADSIVTRFVKLPFRRRETRLSSQDLDTEELTRCLSEKAPKQTLGPDYDRNRLAWIVRRAEGLRRNGSLRKVILRTDKRDVAGWYLYYANQSGMSQVVQLHAKAPFAGEVLDHLINDAWRHSVMALRGRPEPGLMQALSERNCIFSCGPDWALIHSRKPDLLNSFHQGSVFFSRLEGEWCTHFR